VVAFDVGSVIVEDSSGRKKLDGYDNIVMAMGLVSTDGLASELGGKVKKILVVGDAVALGELRKLFVKDI